jgi:autotransporter-associated beta strand protein
MYQPIQQTNTASAVGISFSRRTPQRFLGSSLLAAVIVPFLLSMATSVFGDSATWNLNPTSADWNTAANWTPETVPNGPGQAATFDLSNQTSVNISANTEAGEIAFSSGAGPYTITVAPAITLTISGVGITNDSQAEQTFESSSGPFGTAGSVLTFSGSSTAGTAVINTRGGDTNDAIGGTTFFDDTASAGNATFLTTGSGALNTQVGNLIFRGQSTGANATFTVAGSDFSPGAGGRLVFGENSSAGSAVITATGASQFGITFGAEVQFSGFATAGAATLIATGGMGFPGNINFFESSKGGTARVELFDDAYLATDFHNLPGVTIGSLEGEGLVFPGSTTLTIGSNNLSTTFSGSIQDGGGPTNEGIASLAKVGSGALTLSGTNTYTGSTTVSAGKLVVDGSLTSAVTVNNGGTLGGGGTVQSVTLSTGGKAAPGDPKTLTVNGDYQQAGASTLALAIAGTAPNEFDQLIVGGSVTLSSGSILELDFIGGFAPQAGDEFDLLSFGSLIGSFTTVNIVGLADGFQYTVAPDQAGHLQLTALNNGVAITTAAKLLNISTRADVQTEDRVLIGGFIVTGSSPKTVLLRAIGPSLGLAGVAGALADPVLELHEPDGSVITNDNWRDTQEQAIIDTGIAPSDDLESAIVVILDPGSYTAIVRGTNGGTGVGLVEAYDLTQAADSQLANISTRGFVQTGDNVMIGGFILGGGQNESSSVIVRALGPSLTDAGVAGALQDPTIDLYNVDGSIVASNDNWKDSQQTEIEATGLAPTDDRESAISATLMPGAYTAIERGKDSTSGVGLVEVYRLQ